MERIDLNDHTNTLKTLEKEKIDKDRAIEFVSEKILKLYLVWSWNYLNRVVKKSRKKNNNNARWF